MDFKDQNIHIAGFKHDITDFSRLMSAVNDVSEGCTVQLLNADGIAGEEHALHAALHAIKAFERGQNIAKDLGLEICVRASAQRQISKALDILGLKEGQMNICAVSVGCSGNLMEELDDILDKRGDGVLKPDVDVLKNIYKISTAEIEAAGNITSVMVERTSLLILES